MTIDTGQDQYWRCVGTAFDPQAVPPEQSVGQGFPAQLVVIEQNVHTGEYRTESLADRLEDSE